MLMVTKCRCTRVINETIWCKTDISTDFILALIPPLLLPPLPRSPPSPLPNNIHSYPPTYQHVNANTTQSMPTFRDSLLAEEDIPLWRHTLYHDHTTIGAANWQTPAKVKVESANKQNTIQFGKVLRKRESMALLTTNHRWYQCNPTKKC